MISETFLAELKQLSRVEKLQVIQLLANELTIEEESYFSQGATYDVWSPYDAPKAGETLLKLLDDVQS